MKKIISVIAIIIIAITLTSSCKKVSDELVGTWDIMTFDTKPEGTMQITFDGNSHATRILNSESGMIIDSCTYEVIQKPTKKRLIIRDSKMLPGTDALNGVYRIDKIKNDVIVTTRIEFEDSDKGGAYYRLELKRKN